MESKYFTLFFLLRTCVPYLYCNNFILMCSIFIYYIIVFIQMVTVSGHYFFSEIIKIVYYIILCLHHTEMRVVIKLTLLQSFHYIKRLNDKYYKTIMMSFLCILCIPTRNLAAWINFKKSISFSSFKFIWFNLMKYTEHSNVTKMLWQ